MLGYNYLFSKYILKNIILSSLFIVIAEHTNNLTSFFIGYILFLNLFCILFYIKRNNYYFVKMRKNKVLAKLKSIDFIGASYFPIYYKESEEILYYLDAVETLLKTIPLYIRENFVNSNYIMIVAKRDDVKDIISKKGYLNATGQFLYLDKVIFLLIDDTNKNLLDINFFTYVFYHEWGHFIDYSLGLLSQTFLWRRNYNQDLKIIKRQRRILYRHKISYSKNINSLKNISKIFYNLKNESEYFADTYSKYKISGQNIKIKEELRVDLNKIDGNTLFDK